MATTGGTLAEQFFSKQWQGDTGSGKAHSGSDHGELQHRQSAHAGRASPKRGGGGRRSPARRSSSSRGTSSLSPQRTGGRAGDGGGRSRKKPYPMIELPSLSVEAGGVSNPRIERHGGGDDDDTGTFYGSPPSRGLDQVDPHAMSPPSPIRLSDGNKRSGLLLRPGSRDGLRPHSRGSMVSFGDDVLSWNFEDALRERDDSGGEVCGNGAGGGGRGGPARASPDVSRSSLNDSRTRASTAASGSSRRRRSTSSSNRLPRFIDQVRLH